MSDRHELQAAGKHPAPCARHCESTAYEIEIRRLRSCLKKTNAQAEHFEREWYLRGDELEQLRAEVERLRSITNTPRFKPRDRTQLKYLSHDELVSQVIRLELNYLHRSSMYFHLEQSYQKLRAELAASREREARMRGALEYALRQNDLDMLLTGDEIRDCRAALAEGAQG